MSLSKRLIRTNDEGGGGLIPNPVSITDTGVFKQGNMSINVRGFALSNDGRHLALNNYTQGNLEEWEMSTPYNLSTATLSEENISAGYDIAYSKDGNWFYTQNIGFNYILHYYELIVTNGGWVGNHGSKTSTGYDMIRSNENSLGTSYDGSFFWYVNNGTNEFYKSIFSTPFNPSTLGAFVASPLPSPFLSVRSLKFTNYGYRVYFTKQSSPLDESIYVYNLSVPYDFNSTVTFVGQFGGTHPFLFSTNFWDISDEEGKIYITNKNSAYTIKEFNVNT